METYSEEARKLKNAYARRWRKKNKDKVRAINIRYWENKAKEEALKDGKMPL